MYRGIQKPGQMFMFMLVTHDYKIDSEEEIPLESMRRPETIDYK